MDGANTLDTFDTLDTLAPADILDILVLGGGYAGMMTALRLGNRGLGGRVTLVNAMPDFVERVRHHQLGAGVAPPRRSISRLLRGTGVRFVAGRVTRLDLDRRVARLVGGNELRFDRVVFALGSVGDDGAVPGVREHGSVIGDEAGALQLRARLARGARDVVVVGGGPTGIETAAELAEQGARVTLVAAPGVGAFLSPAGRWYLLRALARLGVRIVDARVREVRADAVVLDVGELPCDACVWAGGFRAAPLARESGLQVNAEGRILVDANLRSLSHPVVYAVGDAAEARSEADDGGATIGSGCKYAMPMGVHAAENLARAIRGEAERPFRIGGVPVCLSLGRRDGLMQLVGRDGQPGGIVTGRVAAWIKERILRFTVWALRLERRFAFSFWPQPRRLPSRRRAGAKQLAT
jgi:NADH dehydrogenase FAD-containing subunit